jgi:hypothetical protein
MTPLEKFNRFVEKHPHHHKTFFNRPHLTRRTFFELMGAGVTGSFLLAKPAQACTVQTQQSVTTINKAKNVIFILLAGAPSHTDLFDMKPVSVTGAPSTVTPTTTHNTLWPMGLMPKIGAQLPNIAIVRSMQAWALVHSLAQTWTQIGRNPAAALGNIAPNIGSVVALETASQATPSQVFPAFLALNSAGAVANGYFPATYAPFKVIPATTGIPNTSNSQGQTEFNTMWSRLHQLDDPLRDNSPLGQPVSDYEAFYESANKVMYNSSVQQAFTYTAADSARYGSTGFGNACLVAKQVLEANQGTRFIQITLGGWDMHVDIYGANNPKGNNLFTLCPQLDGGVGALLADLQANGLFESTLVVMVGEFGRTTGAVTPALGRDHLPQQSIVFAGAGVTGGKIIGSTNADGSDTADFGWSQQRYVKPEDVEATIYSAMGINWTTVRCDDPFHRGFEYVPFSAETNIYQPINELWTA